MGGVIDSEIDKKVMTLNSIYSTNYSVLVP